jgi:phenylpropionate dioxygenase-like ring-hydroxylating dioxygenase large terminal subunit
MVRHCRFEAKPAEPPVGEVEPDLVAQSPLGTDRVAVADQQRPDHQLRIYRRAAGFRKLLCGPYAVDASGPRIVENFLDVAHFPFVHENVLGTPEAPEIADYEAVINDQGVEATGVRVWQPDPYGTGQGDWVSYTYRALRPLTAYLLKESSGPRFSILLTITPHEPARSTAWMWMAMNYGHDVPEADLIAWGLRPRIGVSPRTTDQTIFGARASHRWRSKSSRRIAQSE